MTEFQAENDANQSGHGPSFQARYSRSMLARAFPATSLHGPRWGGMSLDPTSILYVSLFLVLFAFFVVLNVNATEKAGETGAVMASLEKAFGGHVSESRRAAVLRNGKQSEPALDAVLAKLHRDIRKAVPQASIIAPAGADRIEVSLSLSDFFVKHTTRLAPSRELFLKKVATTVSADKNQPLTITIAFGGRDTDVDAQRRVAALAAALGKYGVSPGQLTVVGTQEESFHIRLVLSRG